MIKRIFIYLSASLLFGVFLTNYADAQQRIDPTLEVKRDFDAKLLEITKGKLYSTFADSLGIFDLSFRYTIFDKPIKELYEFSPLPSAAIERTAKQREPVLILRAGSTFPLSPFGSFNFQPHLSKDLSLIMFGDHNSFLGKLPGIVLEDSKVKKGDDMGSAPSIRNNLGLKFKYSHKKGEAGIEALFNNATESYYGFNETQLSLLSQLSFYPPTRDYRFMKDSLSHTYNRLGGKFFARSLNRDPNSFYYDVDISYSNLKDNCSFNNIVYDIMPTPGSGNLLYAHFKSNFNEDYLNAGITAGAGFARFNKILAGFRYESSNSQYSTTPDRSNLEMHPRYIFRKGIWDFNLGFKYNMWWDGNDDGYNIYPSLSASLMAIRDRLSIYASLDGKNNFMNYSKLLDINPWVHPSINIKNIEQPVIAKAGFRGKIKERLSFNIYGAYYEYRNQIYFIPNNSVYPLDNNPANSFLAIYNDEKRTAAGFEFQFKSQSFISGISGEFYSFRDKNNMTNRHYNYSPFELKGYAKYSWRDRITLYSEIQYRQKSPAILISHIYFTGIPPIIYTPSYTNINLEITYNHNKMIALFARVNNLTNSEIIYLANYPMPGINGGAGIILTF
jgi:hypothetical protein